MVPASVNVNRKHNYAREYFGLDDNRFYFIVSFDYYSQTARKNPLGVALAFGYAFPDPEMKVGLLIKSVGPGELDPTVSQQLKNLSTIDKRIIHWTVLSAETRCYRSLMTAIATFRCTESEGFGLGMAEALALGKPVIATDYSGNRDFLTERTGFPVPFSLRKLMPGEYPMGEGKAGLNQTWRSRFDICGLFLPIARSGKDGPRAASSISKTIIRDELRPEVIMDRLHEIRKSL